MNLFDKLTEEALKNQPNFSHLRIVVEKRVVTSRYLKGAS